MLDLYLRTCQTRCTRRGLLRHLPRRPAALQRPSLAFPATRCAGRTGGGAGTGLGRSSKASGLVHCPRGNFFLISTFDWSGRTVGVAQSLQHGPAGAGASRVRAGSAFRRTRSSRVDVIATRNVQSSDGQSVVTGVLEAHSTRIRRVAATLCRFVYVNGTGDNRHGISATAGNGLGRIVGSATRVCCSSRRYY
jgi:hypothetical protein